MPPRIKYIGNSSFEYACIPTNITIPETVSFIGNRAFYGFTHSLGNDYPYDLFKVQYFQMQLKIKITKVDSYLFANSRFDTLILPDTIKSIEPKAFDSAWIRELILPDSCESLGDYAFYKARLDIFQLGKNITSIGKMCFSHSYIYMELILPEKLIIIHESAFSTCAITRGIIFNDNLEIIEKNVFMIDLVDLQLYYYNLDTDLSGYHLIFPKSLKYIGENAFSYNNQILSITFQSTNITIDDRAFTYLG